MENDTRPKTAYPLHEAYNEDRVRTCAGSMVLTEQAGRDPKPLTLYCLSCLAEVPADAATWERARDASVAEGWKPSAKGELTVGSAPDAVRRALYADEQLRISPTFRKGTYNEWIKDGWPLVQAYGLAEGHKLTAAGEKLQREIVAPDATLPDAVKLAPVADDYLKGYAKRAKEPKPKAPKASAPSLPMVCSSCSHGVASHTSRSASYLGSECREPGCHCKRYQQPKSERKPKAKKTKAA